MTHLSRLGITNQVVLQTRADLLVAIRRANNGVVMAITLDSSLNDVLKHLGLRKRDSKNTLMPRKDILRGRKVVLAEATADVTWKWLMSESLLPWTQAEQDAAYEAYRAERLWL